MNFAKRMSALEPGVFARLAARKAELIARGMDIIDLSVGTPDLPPAPHIMQAIAHSALDASQYAYALDDRPELSEAAADWYRRRYGVAIDPQSEVTSLLGSQEGLAHIALTLCDPGDVALVPDPCYPIFSIGPLLAGARLVRMPMLAKNDFLIDFDDIDERDAKAAKLMIVSYPNNPTGATAPISWYRDLVAFAKQYQIAVVHDNAYSELVFTGEVGASFLSVPGAKEVGVEFNSLSKTYAMPGARVGFCLGNAQIVSALKRLKSNIDYGIYLPIQRAAIAAIAGDQRCVERNRQTYCARGRRFVQEAGAIGWDIPAPRGSMFVWAPLPGGHRDALAFCEQAMERAGVIFVPGDSFGPAGAGYLRAAMVQDEQRIAEAARRLAPLVSR